MRCRPAGERDGSLGAMSEYVPEASDDVVQDIEAGVAEEAVRTGVDEVDAVLESVEGLEGRPVDEHVAVFEDAHDRLRGALDGRAADAPDA